MEEQLLNLIVDCKDWLDEETINEAIHFYNHDEYEMALEGLIIEMINMQNKSRKISKERVIELAMYYRLNYETVFENNFWKKFTEWISRD